MLANHSCFDSLPHHALESSSITKGTRRPLSLVSSAFVCRGLTLGLLVFTAFSCSLPSYTLSLSTRGTSRRSALSHTHTDRLRCASLEPTACSILTVSPPLSPLLLVEPEGSKETSCRRAAQERPCLPACASRLSPLEALLPASAREASMSCLVCLNRPRSRRRAALASSRQLDLAQLR